MNTISSSASTLTRPHPHGSPVRLQGVQDGADLSLDVHPNNNGTTDITGRLGGDLVELHVSPGLDQQASVSGSQEGRAFALDIRRDTDGAVVLSGYEGVAATRLRLVANGGAVTAAGTLEGAPARFVVENRNGTLTFTGNEGGAPLGFEVASTADGALHFSGIKGGRPVDATMRNYDNLPITTETVGDFVVGFTPLEQAAIFHVLTA